MESSREFPDSIHNSLPGITRAGSKGMISARIYVLTAEKLGKEKAPL